MKHVMLFCLLVVAVQGVCFADSIKLLPEQRKVLGDASRFHMVRTAAGLPGAIVALCADWNGRFAEPGATWEATDYIRDETLPGKRLIWVAIAGEYYVVHYERGGFTHSFHILVATLGIGERKPNIVWRSIGGPFKDYAAFVSALRNGELDDGSDYH